MAERYKYIYGPVSSWRLGSSLGIDPLSFKKKNCTFDCIYCQVGKAKACSNKRKIFVPAKKIIEELKSLPPLKINYITFSGRGEPTLAKNLGVLIKAAKKIFHKKIAVLTNSTLINRKSVQKDLLSADFVMVKLDAASDGMLSIINHPVRGIKLKSIVRGIKRFKTKYRGKLALQIMFVQKNKGCAEEIADIVKQIKPYEVQLNTPLRPCRVKPLSKKEIGLVRHYFKGIRTVSVYDIKKKKKAQPISAKDTMRRRGKDV